jgi:SAM-dependent methyltransferase
MKNKIYSKLGEIKKHFDKGGNVIQYIREIENSTLNSIDAIQISYDMQAGSYVDMVKKNPESNKLYTTALANLLNNLGTTGNIIEAGVGEATTLANVIEKLRVKPSAFGGFDISWSRIKYAQKFTEFKNLKNAFLFTGDIFHIPMADNSVDIVYTSHSIEPNGGNEKELLQELYRITNRYLVLLEPAYELGSEEARKRMDSHGYVKGLKKTAEDLGYNVIEHRLFDVILSELNPTGLMIIEKNKSNFSRTFKLVCPLTNLELNKESDAYFCADSLMSYPIIGGIPCLLSDNGIITSKFDADIII